MTDLPFTSRRDLREAERSGRTLPPVEAPIEATSDSSETHADSVSVEFKAQQISTSGAINPYAPTAPAPKSPVAKIPVPESADEPESRSTFVYEPVLAEAEEPITSQISLFAVSPNMNVEPQTASIIINNFEPLENISMAISETGEMLKTGSIELPNLTTNTGEIATILDAAQVDEAIAQDSVLGYVSTIAPLRASGVVNTAGKIGIMPKKGFKSGSGGLAALTLAILMVTIGGLVLAAFMLGFF
jgi:hypothetical protein